MGRGEGGEGRGVEKREGLGAGGGQRRKERGATTVLGCTHSGIARCEAPAVLHARRLPLSFKAPSK